MSTILRTMTNPVVEHNAAALVGAIQKLNETVGGWATFTPTARRRARAVYNFSYEVTTGRIVAFRTGQIGADGPTCPRPGRSISRIFTLDPATPEVADDGRVTVAFDFARLPDLRPGQRLGRLIEVVDLECLCQQAVNDTAWTVFTQTRRRANELLAETLLE